MKSKARVAKVEWMEMDGDGWSILKFLGDKSQRHFVKAAGYEADCSWI